MLDSHFSVLPTTRPCDFQVGKRCGGTRDLSSEVGWLALLQAPLSLDRHFEVPLGDSRRTRVFKAPDFNRATLSRVVRTCRKRENEL